MYKLDKNSFIQTPYSMQTNLCIKGKHATNKIND